MLDLFYYKKNNVCTQWPALYRLRYFLDSMSIAQEPNATTFHAVASHTWQGTCRCRKYTERCEQIGISLAELRLVVSWELVVADVAQQIHEIASIGWTWRIQE